MMNRRDFLRLSTALAVGGFCLRPGEASVRLAQDPEDLMDGRPMLLNPGPDGMTVLVLVKGLCTAWIEYGPTPALGLKAMANKHGLHPLSSTVHRIRISGLKPGQTVYYRVHLAAIDFQGPYKIVRKPEFQSALSSFKTLDPNANAMTFSVINDTHEKPDVLASVGESVRALKPDLAFWNGDVFDDIRSDAQISEKFVKPLMGTAPVCFVSGNHDVRGVHARGFDEFVECPGGQRHYVLRHGPVAFIVLDTGEDKPDDHPVYAGLGGFSAYRAQQREWLRSALRSNEVRRAPFRILVCHIPLFGEGESVDSRNAWLKELTRAKIHLSIHGHVHRPRLVPFSDKQPWTEMVGGGPSMTTATVIEGSATPKMLTVKMRALDGSLLRELEVKA